MKAVGFIISIAIVVLGVAIYKMHTKEVTPPTPIVKPPDVKPPGVKPPDKLTPIDPVVEEPWTPIIQSGVLIKGHKKH